MNFSIPEFFPGLLLLFFGRRLLWLFTGLAGFLLGLEIAHLFFSGHHLWMNLLAACGLGLAGVVLAAVAKRIAFVVAGGYAGAYLGLFGIRMFDLTGHPVWILSLAGLAGAILALLLMDWTILLLSSLAGAGLVIQSLGLDHTVAAIAFLILAAAGVFVQARSLRKPTD